MIIKYIWIKCPLYEEMDTYFVEIPYNEVTNDIRSKMRQRDLDDINDKEYISHINGWAKINPGLANENCFYFLVPSDESTFKLEEPSLPYSGQWNSSNHFIKVGRKVTKISDYIMEESNSYKNKNIPNASKVLNGYDAFFEQFPVEKFIDFGLKNIISIETDIANEEWKSLKVKVNNKSNDLFVRDSGRNGTGNGKILKMYADIFSISVNFDKTNNNKPGQIIQKLTGYRKNKTIFNYQISHVFGMTKNVYCFTAPWNIVFIPKIIDPFTGHEAKGIYVDNFQKSFRKMLYKNFSNMIDEYNQLIEPIFKEVNKWAQKNISENEVNNFVKDFKKIEI
jgi:hypothetical protein